MATMQAMNYTLSSYRSPKKIRASFINPSSYRSVKNTGQFPGQKNIFAVEELIQKREQNSQNTSTIINGADNHLVLELLTIAEVVADRAEMHSIIGAQRNNWNHLLTGSINSFTLVASLMAGISSIPVAGNPAVAPQLVAFKIAAVVFFSAAAGLMMIVNAVQPSQLAEEQRKATQLWKQLYHSIRDAMSLQPPSESDVREAMNKVLALEKAYPLPITGMLVKFPEKVKPSRWWPRQKLQPQGHGERRDLIFERNGWSGELEEEMKGLLRVMKAKDETEYVKMGNVMLELNKRLAMSGPLLCVAAAISSGLIGVAPGLGVVPVVLAVLGGALATIVNTLEHGGQVGMVLEMFRNCAGYYKQLEEEIELNLGEEDVGKRENGELFRVKVALQLGRSLSELKELARYASPACRDEEIKEFAGKVF